MPSSDTTPLLGGRQRKSSIRQYFQDDVSKEWTDIILLIGCLSTGMLDSAVFNVWSCFVSMQTGEWVVFSVSSTHTSVGKLRNTRCNLALEDG